MVDAETKLAKLTEELATANTPKVTVQLGGPVAQLLTSLSTMPDEATAAMTAALPPDAYRDLLSRTTAVRKILEEMPTQAAMSQQATQLAQVMAWSTPVPQEQNRFEFRDDEDNDMDLGKTDDALIAKKVREQAKQRKAEREKKEENKGGKPTGAGIQNPKFKK